tara:strand:- start:1989 stop:2213 length:225 start_codon:yes stop_codon:yes gene_type:complete
MLKAKKNEFVEPAEAPGEGRRRPPNAKENEDSKKGVHPIKKFIMDKFGIEEIDYEKFNKENKWAIRPNKDKEDE